MTTPPAAEAEPRPGIPPAPPPAPARGSEYAALSRQVKEAGLLDRRLDYYVWKITGTGLALAAGWAVFVLAGNTWWQLITAVFLAVVFAQLGFLGHDAGHRQVFRSARSNYLLGIACGNAGVGLSYGWWVSKHNRHHAHPNTDGEDPDLDISVLAFSGGRARTSRGLRRLLYRYQAYLLIPLLFLEAIALHTASIRALTSRSAQRGSQPNRASRHRIAEAVLLAAHFGGYLAVVFLVLSPIRAIVFILVQQGLFGFYLGASFAPNHKGMPVLDASDQSSFLQRQVLTSRNVRGGWLTHFALGGLNYQIEHHLFPSMPRPSLPRSQALIAAFCAEHGLPYTEATLLGSYTQALRHLNTIGRLTRPAGGPPPSPAPIRPLPARAKGDGSRTGEAGNEPRRAGRAAVRADEGRGAATPSPGAASRPRGAGHARAYPAPRGYARALPQTA